MRLGRAALFVAGVLGASACGPEAAEEPSEPSGFEVDNPSADIYGAPPMPQVDEVDEPRVDEPEQAPSNEP